jgi:molecular chaperone DnaK (HSP70)
VHPDLCVALGAGVLATRLAGHGVDRVLVDISPYSFGPSYFGSLDGRPSPHCYHPIIPRNTPLPATRTDAYATMVDHQDACEVNIYQGDDPNALNNLLVGRFRIEGLSRVPAGNEVLVRMELDLDGILRVSAIEKRTGLATHITIERATSAMSEADVTSARERMRELFGDDIELEDDDADLDDDVDVEDGAAEGLDTEPHDVEGRAVSHDARPRDDQREHRVAVSEARALLERAERLSPRMTPEDREESQALQRRLEDALKAGDRAQLRAHASELADLLFYVEER